MTEQDLRARYAAHAARSPVFTDYQRATNRIIPVVLLDRIDAPTPR